MSEERERKIGATIGAWWGERLGDREMAHARGLSARLRRANGPVEILTEEAVHDLSARIAEAAARERDPAFARRRAKDPTTLCRLARVLAEVRETGEADLATRLGQGDPPPMSELRFRRLLTAEDRSVGAEDTTMETDELTAALRRAVVMANRTCAVPVLGRDLLYWGETVRVQWTFHYYGAAAPAAKEESAE